ncbi:MAG: BON domain-containing protein, partial [Pirellulaceae bacterium]
GGRGGGGQRGDRRGGGGQGQQAAQGNKVIRTRMKVGFNQPTRSASAVSGSYEKLIRRVMQRDDYADGTVNLVMEGETAVLKGTVGSSHVRDVAERLALLEPGIGAVRNELTLRAAEPKPER